MIAFIKNQENFTCRHCGAEVTGDGYTNHCPECLWSQHVDIYPGDRAAGCGGLMKPVSYRAVAGNYDLLNKCEKCGYEKWNKLGRNDKLEVLNNLV